MRKLIIDGLEWLYSVGKTVCVIKSPIDGKRYNIHLDDLTGRTFTEIERGRHKRTSSGSITPGDVTAYIRKELIK